MDITTREDIITIVDEFYSEAFTDEILGPIFNNHMSSSLESHKPKIYDFWESVLLGTGQYRGNPMQTHIALSQKVKLTEKTFNKWIELWTITVQDKYSGSIANEAISKAEMMKKLMLFKIDQSSNPNFIQ